MKALGLLVAILLAFSAIFGQEPRDDFWSAESPDKAFLAVTREIPDQELIYRRDLDGLLVAVYDQARKEPEEIYA